MPKYPFEDIIEYSTQKRAGMPGDESNFIAMSHIIPHDLEVHSWGVEEPFSDNKLIIKKGDVLFIWRNPQNHQVAVSPIDGLFTAFGMVFRPKTDIIIPEFLPYFISSDTFINKAASLAVGTKDKRVNWKELKNTVFEIPTLEGQRQLMNIINELEYIKTSYDSMSKELNLSINSFYYERIISASATKEISLGELMYFHTKTEKIANIENENYTTYDEIARSANPKKTKAGKLVYAYRIKHNQLLAQRKNFCTGSFTLIPEEYNNFIVSSQLQLFDINQNIILPEFLYYVISQPEFINNLKKIDLTTDNWNFVFSKNKIYVPPVEVQQNFLDFTDKIKKSLNSAAKCKAQTYESLQSLLCEYIPEA